MAMNLPSSPTEGQLFYPINPTAGAPVLKYTGGVWKRAAGTAQRYNRLHAGNLSSSVQNSDALDGTITATSSNYTISDGFAGGIDSNIASVRFQKVAVPSPRGAKHRARATVLTADTSLQTNEWFYFAYVQMNEGNKYADFQWGSATPKGAVLRFGFRGPAGQYSVSIRNNANSTSYPTTFTVTPEAANIDQEWVIAIPGCTIGTWTNDTTRFMSIYFILAHGNPSSASYRDTWSAANVVALGAQSNGLDTVGNVFEFFDLGFYLDPDNTGVPPVYESRLHQDILKDTHRHYIRLHGGLGSASAATISQHNSQVLAVPQRITPVMSMSSTLKVWWPGGSSQNVTTFATSSNNSNYGSSVTLTASTATMPVGVASVSIPFTGMASYSYTPSQAADARN